MPKDLHSLPKLRDSITFLYIEHAIIEQDDFSIVMIKQDGRIPVPIAAMTTLMLGPGVRITHAAVKAVADNGCMVVWCGDHAAKFYAYGMGETRSARNLLLQAQCCMDDERHMAVVRRMYLKRFPKVDCSNMTLQQIRGVEGVRVRELYRQMSKIYGVKWSKRSYKQEEWAAADPINRALSYANTILYSVCQAAILSLGFSTGLGFIHTGKMLSFVYDIADLYKAETTVPVAFSVISKWEDGDMEPMIRRECRLAFRRTKLLERLPQDIYDLFEGDEDMAKGNQVGNLWDGDSRTVSGGKNHGGEPL